MFSMYYLCEMAQGTNKVAEPIKQLVLLLMPTAEYNPVQPSALSESWFTLRIYLVIPFNVIPNTEMDNSYGY